jgi:predicted dehydrogenase
MKSAVAVGIVGCGYWGPNLARNFAALADARLAAVCDTDTARLGRMRALHPAAGSFTDHRKMLRRPDLDAVVIATPLHSHFTIARDSLLAGKHVLIEKPMAASTDECRELIQLAENQGLTLMVGHTFLYSEAVAKITEIIASGDIGDIRYINCQRLNLGLFQQDINVAWDLAPHDLSIILHLMGEIPHTVNCQGNAHINPEIEDVTNISLSFHGKRFATIQSSWLEPRKVRQMTFVGTRKMIVYDDLQPLEKIRIYDVRVDCPPHYDSFAEFHYSYHYGDCHIPHIGQREPLAVMCADFLSSIRESRSPVSCGAKGLEIVGVLEAVQQSLRTHGAPVVIPDPKIVPLAAVRAV